MNYLNFQDIAGIFCDDFANDIDKHNMKLLYTYKYKSDKKKIQISAQTMQTLCSFISMGLATSKTIFGNIKQDKFAAFIANNIITNFKYLKMCKTEENSPINRVIDYCEKKPGHWFLIEGPLHNFENKIIAQTSAGKKIFERSLYTKCHFYPILCADFSSDLMKELYKPEYEEAKKLLENKDQEKELNAKYAFTYWSNALFSDFRDFYDSTCGKGEFLKMLKNISNREY